MDFTAQLIWLFVLAIPIACISWTVTHEELFRECVDYCTKRSEKAKSILEQKLFYILICEYCFSHYVTIMMLFITGYKLLFDDWRGYMIAFFSLVWIANIYMSLFGRLRVGIKSEKTEVELKEQEIDKKNGNNSSKPQKKL